MVDGGRQAGGGQVDLMTFGDSMNRLQDGRVGTPGVWKTDKWTITRAEEING